MHLLTVPSYLTETICIFFLRFEAHQRRSSHFVAALPPNKHRRSLPFISFFHHTVCILNMAGPIERALSRALASRQHPSDEQTTEAEAATTPAVSADSAEEQTAPEPLSIRRRMHVNTLSQRYQATQWMIRETDVHGNKHIASKCVKHFPHLFAGNTKANLEKASRWWKVRAQTMALKVARTRGRSLTSHTGDGIRRANFKAVRGRGRKRSAWVKALYRDLRSEFERLRAAGLKFNATVLKTHAIAMISEANAGSPYHRSLEFGGKPIARKITIRWVQHFMRHQKIVLRAQTGKLQVSPQKELQIEKAVAFHLGALKRGFGSGLLNEDNIENADETHFVFNMDNGKTLGFVGDKHVKYADVVSGGEPITLMVRLSGGRDATIHPPMLIFKNGARSYPVRGVPDIIPGVCYRTGPKGWMDGTVWKDWLSEPRAIKALGNNRRRVLYVDNCSSHTDGDAIQDCLRNIRTTLQKFPPNATHLIQPADSFIIQKIKEAWRKLWDEYKYRCIKAGEWMDSANGKSSGKIRNPGKTFFLRLASEAVRQVNAMRDKNGVQYARKAMIMTGMSLNLNGRWEESQLTDELQAIIAKHRNHFEGEPVDVDSADVETESDTETE